MSVHGEPAHPWGEGSPGDLWNFKAAKSTPGVTSAGWGEKEGWVLRGQEGFLGRGRRRCGRFWGAFRHVPMEEEEEEAIPGS